MKYFQFIFLLFIYAMSYSQEFQSTIWLEDINGRMDSVTIGYDPSASESIDGTFGALDITNQPWAAFEIRASQIDVTEIINGEDISNPRSISDLSRYQTKTEIIPKNCSSLIEVSNQAGYVPFITLFIASDAYPIKIKWNQTDFENDCLSKSVISDWPISTWWDIPCCSNLEINETLFSETNEITIHHQIGMQVVNENLDTLIMLNISLKDGLETSTKKIEDESDFTIYPNPSNGVFYIPQNAEIMNVIDRNGNIVLYKNEGQKISIPIEGVFFIQLNIEGIVSTKRIMNF